MDRNTLARFKDLFENERDRLLEASHGFFKHGIWIDQDSRADDADLTEANREANLAARMRGRETQFLKKLDDALERIRLGTFGICQDCSEEIEVKRLAVRPTATECIHCKEVQESREAKGLRGISVA